MGTPRSGRFLVTWTGQDHKSDPQIQLLRAGMAGRLVLSPAQAASLIEQLDSVLLEVWMRTAVDPVDTGSYVEWRSKLRDGAIQG